MIGGTGEPESFDLTSWINWIGIWVFIYTFMFGSIFMINLIGLWSTIECEVALLAIAAIE